MKKILRIATKAIWGFTALIYILILSQAAFATPGCTVLGGWPGAQYGLQAQILTDSLPCYGITGTKNSKVVLQTTPTITTPNFTTSFSVDSVIFGSHDTNYHRITDGSGSNGLTIGNVTDPTNYYANDVHSFTNKATSTNFANISSAGIGVYGATSGLPHIAAQAIAGTPTLTLPNASGTFAVSASSPLSLSATTGALTCATCNATGTGNSATTLIVGSSTTLPSPAIGVFTGNTTTLPNPATGTVLQLAAANGAATNVTIDAFAQGPSVTFRRADTSAGSPSAVQSGEVMLTFGGAGYGATGYSATARMQITGKATENWSDTAQGTSLQFNTTPNTTIVPALALLIQNSGGVSIGTSTDLGIGTLLANSTIKTLSTTVSSSPTTGSGLFGGGIGVSGDVWASGNHSVSVAAKTLLLKQGANGAVGTFVCNGVTPVTVNNTNVAISDAVIISLNTVGGTVGAAPDLKTITAATGFTVACTAADTSTYNYALIKNAA